MFTISINSNIVLFSKFFAPADREAVLAAIPEDTRQVLFVDTGATPDLAATIRSLVERGGVNVVVRDHHRGEGRTPDAATEIEAMLGDSARIVTRAEAPACAQLVELGEFAQPGTVIVADPDLDGLTAAMKAAGVSYDGLGEDAEVFDLRPKQSAETLTSLGWTAVRALRTLPPVNKERPEAGERAKADFFGRFVAAAQGNVEAREALESAVAEFEAQVEEAERLLAEKMSVPCNGVAIVDQVGAGRSDLNTLTRGMERTGAVVTGVRKDFGPIAGNPGGHGVQISLAVAMRHQEEIDLRDLVPEGMESSPQAGLLSNTSFLLHCSEAVWEETILPALHARMRIRAAFKGTDEDYLIKTLAQRQPGEDGMGSRFLRETSIEEVRDAAWTPYVHPAVQRPAVAFRAPIPGTFGLVRLDSIEPTATVVLRDGHDTSFVEACVPGGQGPEVDFTVLLLGPSRKDSEKEVVWTFFPGDPVMPSRLSADAHEGRELTAAEAIGLGLVWAKVEA